MLEEVPGVVTGPISAFWKAEPNSLRKVGSPVGINETDGTADTDGAIEGCFVKDGSIEGCSDGRIDSDGLMLGCVVSVGTSEGNWEGSRLGSLDTLGSIDGCFDVLGAMDGAPDGASDCMSAPATTNSIGAAESCTRL